MPGDLICLLYKCEFLAVLRAFETRYYLAGKLHSHREFIRLAQLIVEDTSNGLDLFQEFTLS